jgi:hypothetical protein
VKVPGGHCLQYPFPSASCIKTKYSPQKVQFPTSFDPCSDIFPWGHFEQDVTLDLYVLRGHISQLFKFAAMKPGGHCEQEAEPLTNDTKPDRYWHRLHISLLDSLW